MSTYRNYNNQSNSKFTYTKHHEDDSNNRYNQYKQSFTNSVTSPKYENHNFQVYPEQDADYDKFNNLRKQFDSRIKSLYSELKSIVNKLDTDEILQTMKKDVITNEYYSQRIKEIVDEGLHLEREELVKRLNEEICELKEKYSIAERQNGELIERIKNLTDTYEKKLEESNGNNNQLTNDLNRMKSSVQNLNSTYDGELKRIIDDCNIRLSKQNNDLSKYKEDNSNLNERLNVYNL